MIAKHRIVTASMSVAVVAGLLAFLNEYAIAGSAGAPVVHAGHWYNGGAAALPGLRRIVSQLDLSDAQRTAIHQVVVDARATARAQRTTAPPDLQALLVPTDGNHAAAVETAKQRAAQRVQQWVDTEQKIYALLTPEQQARLPQLLASRPSRG